MYVDTEDWKRVVGVIAGGVCLGMLGFWIVVTTVTAALAALS